mmetsp:Transcript_18210/g.46639  ORF Transcript_18210/g.46639 Transcript_18210/m.46639 type:complete len:264 (+) Transcript_18210:541-1332(+)
MTAAATLASRTRSTDCGDPTNTTLDQANESVCICATSTRSSITARFSGTLSRLRPLATHAATRSARLRKTGMIVSDWSSSQQKVGSTQPLTSNPCASACCCSAAAMESTTLGLPCRRISPTKSESAQPMARAKARPSGVTPRCRPAATSGFCSFAEASIRRASSASVNHEHTSPLPSAFCIATIFESALRMQNVGTALSLSMIWCWVSAAFGVAGVAGTSGVVILAACSAATALFAAMAASSSSSSEGWAMLFPDLFFGIRLR